MINAKVFQDPKNHKIYREGAFSLTHGEEGKPELDRPLFIQVRRCGLASMKRC